jgi:hypothetical protein
MLDIRPIYSIYATNWSHYSGWRMKGKFYGTAEMDEDRKRMIDIMAAILATIHMQTADNLFGGPQGSPPIDAGTCSGLTPFEILMRLGGP